MLLHDGRGTCSAELGVNFDTERRRALKKSRNSQEGPSSPPVVSCLAARTKWPPRGSRGKWRNVVCPCGLSPLYSSNKSSDFHLGLGKSRADDYKWTHRRRGGRESICLCAVARNSNAPLQWRGGLPTAKEPLPTELMFHHRQMENSSSPSPLVRNSLQMRQEPQDRQIFC